MPPLVFIHVVISLPGIGSGIVVLLGFFGNKRPDAGTHFLLMTTTLTSVTGFPLPCAPPAVFPHRRSLEAIVDRLQPLS